MEFSFYKGEWLEALRAQDDALRMEKLDAEDALKIGLIMIRLAREVYKKPVSVRVVAAGQTTFSYLMQGTTIYNEWWMDKKLNTSRLSGESSIRTLVELAEGAREMEPEYENEQNFALCGGCVPVKNGAGRLLGYVECSGMPHQCDHQLIADALAEYLGRSIPRIID